MQIRRRAITVGTTFFLAAATGHVMQNGDVIGARLRGDAPAPVLANVQTTAPTAGQTSAAVATPDTVGDIAAIVPAQSADAVPSDPAPVIRLASADPVALLTDEGPAGPELAPQPVLTASGLPDLPLAEPAPLTSAVKLAGRIGQLESGYARPDTAADDNYSVFGLACADPSLSLEPSARAILKVKLSAPCFGNERVTFSHAGLVFTMTTDQAGDVEVMLPAMTEKALVQARFSSGDMLSATHDVTGLESLARVAVQWQGDARFHLHAFENAAGFDMPGHVWAEAPRERGTSDGGFLTLLGDPAVDYPRMAEIYTVPAGTSVDGLVVEAMVTEATCGRLAASRALRMTPSAKPTSETLTVAMPECDAVGESAMLPISPVAVPQVAMVLGTN